MNILLLSNGAPNYHYFFNTLASLLMQDGAVVVAAVDSTFSREENGLDNFNYAAISDFSAFFATHKTDFNILSRYEEFDLNGALLSDYERAQVYDIWGDQIGVDYFDRLKSALLTFFEEIFERYSIDLVLYENVSNAFSHYALFIAKKRNATYFGLAGSRLPGRFAVTADPLADDRTEQAFHAIRAGSLTMDSSTLEWVRDYIANIETIVPDYMKINGLERIDLASRYLRRDRVRKIASLIRHARDNRTDAFQIGNPLRTYRNLFLRNVRRRIRANRVRKIYQEAVAGEKFLLYPIHFHPEASTSILAGTYLDEYEVIRNIAFSLPEGVRLYVKDHLSAWAYPSLEFYKKIKNLPNVRLLGPNEPTKRLISLSLGVITLTSTVGYEALILKRRVFLYGTVFYDFHRGVIKVDNPAKLRHLFREWLYSPVDWDDEYNQDFICAYYETTLPGSLNLMLPYEGAAKAAAGLYTILRQKLFASDAATAMVRTDERK
jgi:hypothetical protein